MPSMLSRLQARRPGIPGDSSHPPAAGPAWRDLPGPARAYVATVILLGGCALVVFFPRSVPSPVLFSTLLVSACLISAWKVNLPIPVANGATLSVSYAASLTSLLLLGSRSATVIAAAAVFTQCVYKPKERYPLHRTLFSTASAVLTMLSTGAVYALLDGPIAPFESMALAKPLVGAIATYFVCNTGLVAAAIALSSRQGVIETWRRDFLWLGASFMAAAGAGALAAVVVDRGEHWKAVLLGAPIYVTYRTYQLFVGRLEDQKRHMSEICALHEQTVRALNQAHEAERALAAEKERLTATLQEMTLLEQARNLLLVREQEARASAEEANRLKDQFLATVSHELRTPLTSILGWADMLRRDLLDDERRNHGIDAIYGSARRQAQLIDDLLDISRIVSGKLRLERTLVDLQTTIFEAHQVVQPAADAKGVRITVEADPSVGAVLGDAARLQQITWNLLSNAVKFTAPGGAVLVRLRRAPGNLAEIVVTDTGEGIAPDFLPAVFEAFRQADGSTTRHHRGLGIGLSIVRTLAEAHGGTVSAESAGRGQGATFSVRLPMAGMTDRTLAPGLHPAFSADMRSTPLSLKGLSVLVVEDEPDTREVVASLLSAVQATVFTASDAADALEVLQKNHVDVLLADVGLPSEDGYSLIRKVRSLNGPHASIPAAALTAFARDEDRQQALEAGFQIHLAKPVEAQALVAAVAALGKAVSAPGGGTTATAH